MKGLHALVALFAAFMLFRHVPRAVSLLKGQGPRAMGIVSIVNVVLALLLLSVAVKGLL